MVYFGESSIDCWEECILCCCRMEYSIDICEFIRSMASLSSRISFLIFYLDDLSVGDTEVLNSPITTVLESICTFKSFSVFDEIGCILLIIVISFWCIALFISLKWPSLSHFTNVSLNSTLSDIGIAVPAYYQGPLAW
jgi:hypothetical protein